jgi:translation initiation factor IF-3
VRLINAEGENIGVVPLEEAMDMAADIELDLVEVSPGADPPVCKILDYGKYKYEAQKKQNVARKKQKTIDVKEIKMRPNIDLHDYDVKMRSMVKFLDEGDKVKVTLRFRGRELAHQDRGMMVLDRVRDDLEELAKVEQYPKMEGRQMVMVISPK